MTLAIPNNHEDVLPGVQPPRSVIFWHLNKYAECKAFAVQVSDHHQCQAISSTIDYKLRRS